MLFFKSFYIQFTLIFSIYMKTVNICVLVYLNAFYFCKGITFDLNIGI